MCVYTYACIHVRVHIRVHTCACTHTRAYMCVYTIFFSSLIYCATIIASTMIHYFPTYCDIDAIRRRLYKHIQDPSVTLDDLQLEDPAMQTIALLIQIELDKLDTHEPYQVYTVWFAARLLITYNFKHIEDYYVWHLYLEHPDEFCKCLVNGIATRKDDRFMYYKRIADIANDMLNFKLLPNDYQDKIEPPYSITNLIQEGDYEIMDDQVVKINKMKAEL